MRDNSLTLAVVIYLTLNSATNLHHDWLKNLLVCTEPKSREVRLWSLWNVFLSIVIPHYLHFCDPPPMLAINHVSLAVLLTCYDFFLLWSSNLDFLFYSSVTFQTCISVFLTLFFYLSPSFPSFSPCFPFLRVLFLSSCVIFLGTYGPWHCHTHKFLSLFLLWLCFLFFSCHTFLLWYHSKNSDVNIKISISHLWLVNNLSYPWLPMCDMQSGSSSAVHADCALAVINWFCSRRKRIVWAFEIFGPRHLWFLCLLTLVQPHTRLKKDEESRHWFHDVITGCSVLASFSKVWGFKFC